MAVCNRRSPSRTAVAVLVAAVACKGLAGHRIETVESLRAARKAHDAEAVARYVDDDPRIWYEAREGAGAPWTLGSGRWKAWDEHFKSESKVGAWQVEDDRVWADVLEMNEYYALTERGPGWYRATYFFDGNGRVEGVMISAVPGKPSERGRRDEFEAWAREHWPEEAEALMPGGSIDPTGDRAPRMRALLMRWRAAVGLPSVPVESDPPQGV